MLSRTLAASLLVIAVLELAGGAAPAGAAGFDPSICQPGTGQATGQATIEVAAVHVDEPLIIADETVAFPRTWPVAAALAADPSDSSAEVCLGYFSPFDSSLKVELTPTAATVIMHEQYQLGPPGFDSFVGPWSVGYRAGAVSLDLEPGLRLPPIHWTRATAECRSCSLRGATPVPTERLSGASVSWSDLADKPGAGGSAAAAPVDRLAGVSAVLPPLVRGRLIVGQWDHGDFGSDSGYVSDLLVYLLVLVWVVIAFRRGILDRYGCFALISVLLAVAASTFDDLYPLRLTESLGGHLFGILLLALTVSWARRRGLRWPALLLLAVGSLAAPTSDYVGWWWLLSLGWGAFDGGFGGPRSRWRWSIPLTTVVLGTLGLIADWRPDLTPGQPRAFFLLDAALPVLVLAATLARTPLNRRTATWMLPVLVALTMRAAPIYESYEGFSLPVVAVCGFVLALLVIRAVIYRNPLTLGALPDAIAALEPGEVTELGRAQEDDEAYQAELRSISKKMRTGAIASDRFIAQRETLRARTSPSRSLPVRDGQPVLLPRSVPPLEVIRGVGPAGSEPAAMRTMLRLAALPAIALAVYLARPAQQWLPGYRASFEHIDSILLDVGQLTIWWLLPLGVLTCTWRLLRGTGPVRALTIWLCIGPPLIASWALDVLLSQTTVANPIAYALIALILLILLGVRFELVTLRRFGLERLNMFGRSYRLGGFLPALSFAATVVIPLLTAGITLYHQVDSGLVSHQSCSNSAATPGPSAAGSAPAQAAPQTATGASAQPCP